MAAIASRSAVVGEQAVELIQVILVGILRLIQGPANRSTIRMIFFRIALTVSKTSTVLS